MELSNEPKKTLREKLAYHLSDSTALSVTTTPIFVAFETLLAGISDENSRNARLLGAALNYVGLGRGYSKGRDLSKKLFKITDKTPEGIIQLHDAIYTALYCGVFQPPFYYAAGVRDSKEIVVGTLVGMGLALATGGPIGYSVDVFRDLIGLKECRRKYYPELFKKQSPKNKKGLVALLIAGAVDITAGIYALTPK